jgi:hypothetical protein
MNSGDFDFLVFSAAEPPPPSITATPLDSVERNAVILDWTLADSDSQVDVNSVKVFIDDQDVSDGVTADKTDTGATVHLDISGQEFTPGNHSWRLEFSDNSDPVKTVTGQGTLRVNPFPIDQVFTIEAEDFNYSEDKFNGGLYNPQAGVDGLDVNVMPYYGGAYSGLSAIEGIDFNNDDALDQDDYPRDEVDISGNPFDDLNEVDTSATTGQRYNVERGPFEVTQNFRIGWVNIPDWQNYTRDFPDGAFNVWAGMSFGGRGPNDIRATMDLVTSDPTQPDQTVESMGAFNSPGSGGWGRNELVPLRDGNGDMVTANMGGVETVRVNLDSGDFDYLLFIPATTPVERPQITKVQVNGDGTITIEWTGGGTLQATTDLVNGPWQDVTDISPYTFTPDPGVPMMFGRIKL